MSLVNEYLQKTQQDAPGPKSNGAVPPILTSGGSRKDPEKPRRTWILFLGTLAVLGIVIVAVFPVLHKTTPGDSAKDRPTQTASTVAVEPAKDQVVAAVKPAPPATVPTAGQDREPEPSSGAAEEAPAETTKVGPDTLAAGTASAAAPTEPETLKPDKPKTVDGPQQSTIAQNKPRTPQAKAMPDAGTEERVDTAMAGNIRTDNRMPPVSAPLGGGYAVGGQPISEEVLAAGLGATYAPSQVTISSQDAGSAAAVKASKTKKEEKPGVSGEASSVQRLTSTNYYQLGLIAQQQGNYSQAERYYQLGLQRSPTDLNILINLSSIYLSEGKDEDAARVLKKAQVIGGNNPKLLTNMGLLELHRNNMGQAKQWFGRALNVSPRDVTVLTNLAYLAQMEDNSSDMEDYYGRILQVTPQNGEVILAYASLLERQARYGEATDAYNRALKLDSVKSDSQLNSQIRARIRLLRQITGNEATGIVQ